MNVDRTVKGGGGAKVTAMPKGVVVFAAKYGDQKAAVSADIQADRNYFLLPFRSLPE